MVTELVSCPACGRKNASDRPTCLSCGANLPIPNASEHKQVNPPWAATLWQRIRKIRLKELKDALVGFGWIALFLLLLAVMFLGAVLGVFGLFNSWMDETLDAWLNKPVSNGLMIFIGSILGWSLYAIGSELSDLKNKLNDLEEKLEQLEEERELHGD